MFKIGAVSIKAEKLINTTYDSMMKAIEVVKAGIHLGDIGSTIQKHVEDLIASEILNSMINEGDTINIDYTLGKDELNIKIQNKKESKTSKK